MKKLFMIVAVFLLSGLATVIPASSDTSVSGNSTVQGRIVSIDKVTNRLTVTDSITGSNTTIPVPSSTALSSVKDGDMVAISLKADGSAQSVTKK